MCRKVYTQGDNRTYFWSKSLSTRCKKIGSLNFPDTRRHKRLFAGKWLASRRLCFDDSDRKHKSRFRIVIRVRVPSDTDWVVCRLRGEMLEAGTPKNIAQLGLETCRIKTSKPTFPSLDPTKFSSQAHFWSKQTAWSVNSRHSSFDSQCSMSRGARNEASCLRHFIFWNYQTDQIWALRFSP